MRDRVVIGKYPDVGTVHYVYFNGNIVAGVHADDLSVILYHPYHKLLDCDKELVDEHVDEFICVLEITNRLTS